MGLLDKINAGSGTNWTKEEFLQDCLNRAGSQEIFDQAYDCLPRGSSSAIVPWSTIQLCSRDYSDYERAHIEEKQIIEKFGEFRPERSETRLRQIHGWLSALFSRHSARTARHALGFDVAASGLGDLAAIYIDRREGAALKLSALLTFRTEDWNFIESCLYWMMDHSTAVHGAGDETGLGRQICWNASKKFAGRFDPVNFSGDKHDMGFALMNQMQAAEKQWPAEEKDIASDFFALQKLSSNGKWRFSEGTNQLNAHSHCDIAWAGALSTRASTQAGSGYQNELTIGYAQANKLSGPRPGVLGVVTNRLRSSLRRSEAEASGDQVTGAIGSNVAYAAVHEYGFDGEVTVRAFSRRNVRRDLFSVKKHKLSAAGVSYVKSFTRSMHVPERSFIRSSISERIGAYDTALSAAVLDALGGAR